jgi:16S rRNA G966 N2-methylase RsmD
MMDDNNDDLRIDVQFRALCPPLQPEELTQLEANLIADGCRDPLVVWHEPDDGRWLVADGHNRLALCRKHGIPFALVELKLTRRNEVMLWILETQFGRRNLSEGARALLAVKYEEVEAALAKERTAEGQKKGGAARVESAKRDTQGQFSEAHQLCDHVVTELETDEPAESTSVGPPEGAPKGTERAPTSRARASKRAGISEGTLVRAKYVLRHGDDQTASKLASGQVKIGSEFKRLKNEKRKRELEEKTAAALASRKPEDLAVRCCSMQELLAGLDEHSVAAILTDPPYSQEFLPLYEDLARLAKPVLKPDGVLAVMVGQSYLPEILTRMTKHMTYRWTLAYLTPGGQAVQLWARKVNTFWKPVLLFGGEGSWLGDVIKSDVNDNDKRFHAWGQSESGMARLVECLTAPGDLVCDPFAGGGTTGVVCAALGRRFIGCDIDAEAVKLGNARILDAAQRAREAEE